MMSAARWLASTFAAFALSMGAMLFTANDAAAQKDDAPGGSRCDRLKKNSPAWKKCVGQTSFTMSDNELYYAGYWLARTGKYQDALGYLTRARTPDEKVLTYIGFATRKLGDHDTAMGYYARALDMNPNYTVARAYLGEAYLDVGKAALAKEQLAEIEQRCGIHCADYTELDSLITKHENKS
jgi:tetratricopeptide (TPR) repeat protein